jgi:hypothetical protein
LNRALTRFFRATTTSRTAFSSSAVSNDTVKLSEITIGTNCTVRFSTTT